MNQLRQACGQQEMCTLPERYDVGSDKEHEANSSPSPPSLKPMADLTPEWLKERGFKKVLYRWRTTMIRTIQSLRVLSLTSF